MVYLPFLIMLIALLLGVPIAFSLAIAGMAGIYLLEGDWSVVLRILGTTPYGTAADYVLTTIPMFILMAPENDPLAPSRAAWVRLDSPSHPRMARQPPS